LVLQGLRWMTKPDSPLYVRPSQSPSHIRFMVKMARHCTRADFRRGLRTTLRLAEGTNDMLDEWARDGLSFESHTRGVLLAFESRRHFDAQADALEVFSAHGLALERLHNAAVQAKEPALDARYRYGLFNADDRQIEPDSLTRALVKRCTELGGEVREHASVATFLRSGDRVTGVRTATGDVTGDAVLLAAGVWTGQLSRALGSPLPIRPGKGYSIDYAPSPVRLRTSLTLEDAHVAITPLNGRVRLAGTMEFGRLDDSVDRRRVAAIAKAAEVGLRGWGRPRGAEPWAGSRPMTPDGLPIIGRLPALENVYVASGHGMLGLTLAPSTAELVVEMLVHDRVPLVADALSPQRYPR
jgi:D-amino-acid dehydrogenase